MDIIEAVKISCQMLWRNKARSFLTMLGIVIGIMAVIVVMSAGASAQELILNEFKSMGSSLIGVLPGKADESGAPASAFGALITTLKNKDGEDILRSSFPHLVGLSMYVRGNDVIVWENIKIDTNFVGVSASYPDVENAKLEKGRFFSEDEELSSAKVAVIGATVSEQLFGDQDPIGKKIKVKKSNFTIIGVFTKRGGGLVQNQDKEIYVPLRTAQHILLGIDYISMMRIKADADENIDDVILNVETVLRRNHEIDNPKDDDFTVRSSAKALEALSGVTDAIKFFLVAISAVSLIVGGFGIMNIMLATVQERTKEIGLRKAVGAKNYHIILQFLVEAVVVTFISGILGILVGVFISFAIAQVAGLFGYEWDFIVSFSSVVVASIVSIGVGLFFGIIPARRASLLNPIEALRYE